MSKEKIPWYGIASSISTHKWVINIMLYKDREEAERHAQNLRENDFAPKYVEVVEVFLPDNNENKMEEDLQNSISAEKALGLLQIMKCYLIDIRTIEERRKGFPKNSLHIPWKFSDGNLNDSFKHLVNHVVPENKSIAIISDNVEYAKESTKFLREVGFKCYYVNGGVSEWKKNKLPWKHNYFSAR